MQFEKSEWDSDLNRVWHIEVRGKPRSSVYSLTPIQLKLALPWNPMLYILRQNAQWAQWEPLVRECAYSWIKLKAVLEVMSWKSGHLMF